MKLSRLSLASLSLVIAVTARAATIPYPNVGTIAPQNSLTAAATGEVFGYFVQGGAASGGGAAALDYVRLVNLTAGTQSVFLFNNQTSTAGLIADFGHVNAGDTLVFELENVSFGNQIFASSAAFSADNINHAYTVAYAGGILNGAAIPAGTYVGMEDLPYSSSDLNYNDDSFVFTNVMATVAPVPEPSSLLLLGTGVLTVAGAVRRRLAL